MQNLSMRFEKLAWAAAAAIGLGVSLLAAGCGPSGPIMNQNYLKTPPKNWVSLSPGTTEISPLLAPRLIGRSASDDFPASVEKLPVVAGVKPDYEQIAELKPDFIFYDPSLYSQADIEKLKQLNIPLYQLDGNTVDEYFQSLYKIAAATVSENTINDYITRVRSAINSAKGDAFSEPHKTVLLMPFPNSNPMIAGVNSFYADLVRCAGGDPVGPPDTNYVTISPEALMKLNPDAIIIAGDKKALTSFMSDPRFGALAALKAGRIFSIEPDLVERRGERVDTAVNGIHAGLSKVLQR